MGGIVTSEAVEGCLTGNIIADRLKEVLESKFEPREWRMSESGACPRKRVLRVLGYEEREPGGEEAAYFERGNILESWLGEQYERLHPGSVLRQVEVMGPGCMGHIDLYLPEDHLIVEVKTANDAAVRYGIPKREHLFQVQAYHHFGRTRGIVIDGRVSLLPEDTSAEIVYFLLGRELRYAVYPIRHNPVIGQDIENNLLALQEMAGRGEVPPTPAGYAPDSYPCAWQGGHRRCPFYDHCWSEQDCRSADEAPDAAALFRDYAAVKRQYLDLSCRVKPLKEHLDYLEVQLEDVFAARGIKDGALTAEGVQIKRTPVAGRVTYDVETAALAGAVDLRVLEPFKRETRGYTKWTVIDPAAKGGGFRGRLNDAGSGGGGETV